MVFLLAAVLLVPANALASNSVNDLEEHKTQNDYTDNKLEPDASDLPNPMQASIDTNLTDLHAAHSKVTNIMITQNESTLEQYTGPDIPLTMVYIDDDTLVVGLDPAAAYFDVPIEPEYIQFLLDIDEAVEIQYVEFQPESHATPDRIKQWQDKYKNACQPVKPGYQKVCEVYKKTMANLHVPIPTGVVTPPTPPAVTPPTTSSSTSPCDDKPKGLACYYYKLYEKRCIDGNTHKRCPLYATSIKNAGYSLPSDSGTSTPPKPVVIPTYELKNIKAAKSGDYIKVSWDKPADFKVRYYKIYVSEDGGYDRYKARVYPTADSSYTLTGIDEGKTYKFKIKMYYTNDRGSTSIKSFYSDVVSVPRTTPVCADSQMLRGNACVDRCLANNEQWRNGMCVVTSCPSGQIIQNNACVTAPKTPVVTSQDKTQCIMDDDLSRQNGGNCEHNYYHQRINDKTLSGGDIIGYAYKISGDDATYTGQGTITIGATKDNEVGLITAAHVLVPENGHKPIFQQIFEDGPGIRTDVIANFSKVYSVEDYRGKTADVAFVPITGNYTMLTDTIVDHNNKTINIIDKGSTSLGIHTPINMLNATHTTNGIINILNVTMRDDRHVVNNNQIIGNWTSASGNSGAPIITVPTNGEATLVGLHVGKLCQYLSTENEQSRWYPNTGCYQNLTVLSPWEGIIKELGLDN
jgi:hypothetical protein